MQPLATSVLLRILSSLLRVHRLGNLHVRIREGFHQLNGAAHYIRATNDALKHDVNDLSFVHLNTVVALPCEMQKSYFGRLQQ